MKINRRRLNRVLVLVLAVSAMFFAGCASPSPKASDGPIHFVQITDTHHGKPVHAYRFRTAVDIINNLPFDIEVVAHTGDFASDNLQYEDTGRAVSNQIARIKYPVICVPGNHDLSMKGSNSVQRLDDCIQVYTKYLGPMGQVHETPDAVFIAVCTEILRREMPAIPGFDPLQWLEAQLAKTGDKPVFVFTHVPDGPDFYNNSLHGGWPEESRRAWRKVLKKGNVKAVFAGHYHRDELQQNDDGIPTHVANAMADFWGRQASFRIYTYENGLISFRTVYIEDPAEGIFINEDGTLAEVSTNGVSGATAPMIP